jgi:uncharacterized protein (TIGR03546 family)
MFWLKLIRDFLKVLRDGQTPSQIAAGFALGSIVGFSPLLTLQGVVIWLIILVLDVNLSAALLAFTVFSLVAYLVDPLFHWAGYILLVQAGSLRDFWAMLYNAPIAPLTRFYNTVVLGSFVVAIILAFPIFFGMKKFVVAYREHLHTRFEKMKIYQAINRSTLVRWYTRIRSLGA